MVPVYLVDQVYQPAIWILQQDKGNNNKSLSIIDLKYLLPRIRVWKVKVYILNFSLCVTCNYICSNLASFLVSISLARILKGITVTGQN